MLVNIAVGSLYIFGLTRGHQDGFIDWCKQVIAICITAFLQNSLLFAGLLTFKDNMLLGLGIMLAANEKNAKEMYAICNEKLQRKDFSVRELITKMHVEVLCTTDDPADSLEYHKKLKEEESRFLALPIFRPEKAIHLKGLIQRIYRKAFRGFRCSN